MPSRAWSGRRTCCGTSRAGSPRWCPGCPPCRWAGSGTTRWCRSARPASTRCARHPQAGVRVGRGRRRGRSRAVEPSSESSDFCSSARRLPSSFASRTVSASALVSSTGDPVVAGSSSAVALSAASLAVALTSVDASFAVASSWPSRRRPGRPRPDRSTPVRRRRRRASTGAGRPRRLRRPRTARRRPRPRRRCPGAPGTNRPTRARPRSAARAGWPAAGGCSARDGLGGANAEPRTCLPKPRAGWTSGVGVRRAGGESRCPIPRPARSGFDKEPSGRFPIGCLRTGEVGVPRGERWNPGRSARRTTEVERRTVGRRRPDVSPAAVPGRCSSAARGRRHPAAARPS